MKIAILTPTFTHFSGIDRVVELQAEEFAEKGDEVTIFTLKSGIESKCAKIVELGMPANPTLGRMYRLFFFIHKSKIKEYGGKLKGFDQVISHLYPMNLIAAYAKKKYGVKYTYYNHGVAFPRLFGFGGRIYMNLFKFLSNLSVKKADSAISISNFLREELKRETGLDSKVVHNRIDTKRFHKGVSGMAIREKFKLGKDPVLLYVGRISPHKGVHLLLHAFNIVLEKVPNAKLLIVGKPTFDNYYKRLKRLIKENVIFTGFVDDKELPEYYAACDVYTTATLWEGFNLTAAEAQAIGKPVVAFDICAHPEVVKDGILVKEGDVEGFAGAVIDILKKSE